MLRVYCRGALSAPLSEGQVRALLSDPARGWVPASGEVILETEDDGWLGLPGVVPVDAGRVVVESA